VIPRKNGSASSDVTSPNRAVNDVTSREEIFKIVSSTTILTFFAGLKAQLKFVQSAFGNEANIV
jgi:hypothetical protein